jgi:HAD superfamily hydrolase (TIGR01509 family)
VLKALLLDLDGTLADTDALHLPTWVDALEPYGIKVDEEFYKHRISGRLNPDVVEDLLPHVSEKEGRTIADTKEADFRDRAVELKPLPGLIEFLEEVRGRGLAISLVTNAPRKNVGAVLRGLGLESYFDSMVLAEEVGIGKPDPEPYRTALRKLGVRAGEAIAFEDSTSGIASAVGASIRTVGIATTQPLEKLLAAGAFLVVEDFADLETRRLLET